VEAAEEAAAAKAAVIQAPWLTISLANLFQITC
jgi:hypothetical protein